MVTIDEESDNRMFAVYATGTSAHDPLSCLEVGDVAVQPTPEDWVTVHVRAASLNHHDLWSLRGPGLEPAHLPAGSPAQMSLIADGAKVWKDIWGSGQGIGAVRAVVPVAELVARLDREYRAALARLAPS